MGVPVPATSTETSENAPQSDFMGEKVLEVVYAI